MLIAAFAACSVAGEPALRIIEAPHATSVEYGEQVLWTYHHDPAEGKPYFHPLNASNGARLSELRPKDHPWHRGLWFSWKLINGVNYWEENPQTGLSDGRTCLLTTQRAINDADQITIQQQLEYAPGDGAPAVMEELRQLIISPPDELGDYTIDWRSDFRALEPLELGRTPIIGEPEGKSYGGYAGLSIRLNKSDVGGAFLCPDAEIDAAGIQNVAAKWTAFNTDAGAGILMMDHPDNLRAPTKWYLAPTMPYFSPAVLFDAPYSLAEGETLILRYRIIVSAHKMTGDKASRALRGWTD